MHIIGLRYIPTSEDYVKYIKGLNAFDNCMNGIPLYNGIYLTKQTGGGICNLLRSFFNLSPIK